MALKKPQKVSTMFVSTIVVVAIAVLVGVKSSLLDRLPPSWYWTSSPGSLNASSLGVDQTGYNVQIFSRDPLIIYIRSFLTKDEIDHVLKLRFVLCKAEDVCATI